MPYFILKLEFRATPYADGASNVIRRHVAFRQASYRHDRGLLCQQLLERAVAVDGGDRAGQVEVVPPVAESS